jgi:class 3 adenylate cyclase/pimeloyl-ACP methyl ester carboxylesterase
MKGEARYCTSADGARIAYWVEGEGAPFVWCPTFVESYSFAHVAPQIERIWTSFALGRRVIRFDQRGTGLSRGDISSPWLELALADLEAVVDAAGLTTFSLGASLASGPYCLLYASRHPERLQRLVLFNTYARTEDVYSREVLTALANLSRGNWDAATRLVVNLGSTRPPEQFELEISTWFKRSTTGEQAAQLIEGAIGVDVRQVLPEVKAPTLVVTFEGESASASHTIAAAIADARLVTLPPDVRGWDGIAPMHVAVSAFLDEDPATSGATFTLPRDSAASPHSHTQRPSAGTAVILFADIVDSTALTERMGDAAFRERARALDTALREIIAAAGGTAIDGKLLGDGVLATFPAASQAIDAALRCGAAGEDGGLPLHLGIHAGDVIREQDGHGRDNVFGGAVNVASRISGLSAPGEVLVSDVVRALARTSASVTFEDRGEHALKGVGEPQRVYAVRATR